jgi:hypothetical protein
MTSEITALLERFRRGPELIATVLTGVHGEETDWAPSPDRWGIRMIVAHVADSEIVGAYRFRLLLAEDDPVIQAYDEKAWAMNLDYARRKPSQSLETFRRTRLENYDLLNNLGEEAFERRGRHTERGAISVRDLLQTYAEHAENHARQMQTLRDGYGAAKKSKV